MRVVFELPTPWTREERDGQALWTHPDVAIRVEVDPLHELPVDRKRWGEQVLMRHVPAGGRIRQTELVNSTSHTGWPLTMVSTVAEDAKGTGVESRITMFYELVYHGTSIAVVIPRADVGRWESALREIVVDAMLRIEPDFRGDAVAGIHELWD